MPTPILLRKAKEIAKESAGPDFFHSAIVHYKGKFLTGKCNLSYKTIPNGSGPYSSAHAELRAIRSARAIVNRKNLRGFSIFVMRTNRRGEIRLSKPCPNCMRQIKEAGLKAEWTVQSKGN